MSNRSHPATPSPTVMAQAHAAALAKAAHELRTPLMAMGMTAELLSEDLDHLARPEVRQLVATLHRNTVWLHQLVENLYEFVALDREPGTLACAPVDLLALHRSTTSPIMTPRPRRDAARSAYTPSSDRPSAAAAPGIDGRPGTSARSPAGAPDRRP
jgi:hypothetical protein